MEKMLINGKECQIYKKGLITYVHVDGQVIGNMQVIRYVENGKLTDYALLEKESGVILSGRYQEIKVGKKLKENVFKATTKSLKKVILDSNGEDITNNKYIDYKENEYDRTPSGIEYDITSTKDIVKGKVKIKVLPLLDKKGKRIETLKSKKALVPVEVTVDKQIIKAYIRVESLISIESEEVLHLIEGIAVCKNSKDTNVAVGRLVNMTTGTITKHSIEEVYKPHFKKESGYRPIVLTNPTYDSKISDISGSVTLPYCTKQDYHSTGAYVNDNSEYLKSASTGKIVICEECASFQNGIGVLLVDDCTLKFINKNGASLGSYKIRETEAMLTRYDSANYVYKNGELEIDPETKEPKMALHHPTHLSLPHVTREVFELIKAGYATPRKVDGEMCIVPKGSTGVIYLDKVVTKKVDPIEV